VRRAPGAMGAHTIRDFILPGRRGVNGEGIGGGRRGEISRERRQVNPREVENGGKPSSLSTADEPRCSGTPNRGRERTARVNPHSCLLCWSCRAR
jgi:hypothetical protein